MQSHGTQRLVRLRLHIEGGRQLRTAEIPAQERTGTPPALPAATAGDATCPSPAETGPWTFDSAVGSLLQRPLADYPASHNTDAYV